MKVIKITTIISLTYCLSGCMTASLLDKIKEESAPIEEVWKNDEIKSIAPSTTGSGEKTWTFIGRDNNYQLTINVDNTGTTYRNFTTLLNNPAIDNSTLEFSKQLNCSTESGKEGKANEFSCGWPDIKYHVSSLTPEEKLKIREALFLHENGPDTRFLFKLTGIIQPKSTSNMAETVLHSPHKIVFTRSKKHFSAKVFLLPFSAIGDVITAPFQAIGYVIIMHSLPAMHY